MPTKRPKIVIIGAGMAGITAANKLYRSAGARDLLEICVVEGGARIGGRINTSEFGGDRIEMGATWIHGIKGSPVHKIAQEINSMESDQPWECMDSLDEPVTIAEGGLELGPSLIDPVSSLFKKLMDFAQGKAVGEGDGGIDCKSLGRGNGGLGPYLRAGLEAYWKSAGCNQEDGRMALEEAVFAMHENTQRTYTSAGDLDALDYNAESEYIMFPGEEVTIAKGYLSVLESLTSILPAGLIQLGRRVVQIQWQSEQAGLQNGLGALPVVLHFHDGSTMRADHVIVTVSLGVLKQGIGGGLFSPRLPVFKTEAISKLGYGVVNKLFLQLSDDQEGPFPNLQLAFHPVSKDSKIPWWMRKTATLSPIYSNSRVLLSWFAGEEALQLESMDDEDILAGVSSTLSNFLPGSGKKIRKVLKSRWGSDPLFLGSYSYVAVGSSGEDMDAIAEPLPKQQTAGAPPLQILFAGEATHRTHYSTTHGAYFSGLREAGRLLQHYKCSSGGGGI